MNENMKRSMQLKTDHELVLEHQDCVLSERDCIRSIASAKAEDRVKLEELANYWVDRQLAVEAEQRNRLKRSGK